MGLSKSDLIVDGVYKGSRNCNASDDPLPSLLGVDSGAGFRHLGQRPSVSTLKLVVLKSNFNDPDWPDYLDKESGIFTYFGDNKKPSRELHNTPRKGNLILKNMFEFRHDLTRVDHFPPIFIFGSTGYYRDVRFLGLAVPGSESMGPENDLVALWKTGPNELRFQNYRSYFSILDVSQINRNWIKDIQNGIIVDSPHAPQVWLNWLRSRKYKNLIAPRSIEVRSREEQLPREKNESEVLQHVYSRYKTNPIAFEKCAMEIARLIMPDINSWELTRPWRDGGMDAIGGYHIGSGLSAIEVDFALEAKCYNPEKGVVGVRELSRLISRLRHRQFGILVTTSYLGLQAYKELKEDKHPVVIISGGDIAKILDKKIGKLSNVSRWLDTLDNNTGSNEAQD